MLEPVPRAEMSLVATMYRPASGLLSVSTENIRVKWTRSPEKYIFFLRAFKINTVLTVREQIVFIL
jgi:hypothetical protein